MPKSRKPYTITDAAQHSRDRMNRLRKLLKVPYNYQVMDIVFSLVTEEQVVRAHADRLLASVQVEKVVTWTDPANEVEIHA